MGYDELLGPAVRIGILQHQAQVRISLEGDYRVSAGEKTLDLAGRDFRCELKEGSKPAELQWRLVVSKCFSEEAAQAVGCPSAELEPLTTIALGFEFGPGASAMEYWRCSKAFATRAEAERVRDTLANPQRISVLPEVARPASGCVQVSADGTAIEVGQVVRFEPIEAEASRAIVHDVIVGVDYHWRHFERQRFRGVIEVRVDNMGQLTVVNEVPAEAYLFSVNSSEMMSVMPDELLKAQTVAARNTLFATMGKHHYADAFHLCADDHCQCYRGSSRETADSRRVTLSTVGEVLTCEGAICDARYSKMCGGIIEAFESVWNEDPRAYLPAAVDAPAGSDAHALYPAASEERAAALIDARPDCWCNTTGGDVPTYLKYSAPYFRWQFRYTREEAERLLSRAVGAEISKLRALVPLQRGASGRIEYLKVVAANGEWVIGKELQIRKALSPTCLYSSAFVVEYEYDSPDSISAVILRGAGWGHGAGLCQVGATMMAYKGKNYREILAHYYPKTEVASLGKEAGAEQLQSIISHKESRTGEHCFEFFNCYAVASCPIYTEGVHLQAKEIDASGKYAFEQPSEEGVELEQRAIKCQFLDFQGKKATVKG